MIFKEVTHLNRQLGLCITYIKLVFHSTNKKHNLFFFRFIKHILKWKQ
uniref:Uncharacterized protein n=1 Tax=Arundo donax TaxID=35708 RepID=A0A0A9FDJ1_ARUDO